MLTKTFSISLAAAMLVTAATLALGDADRGLFIDNATGADAEIVAMR